MAYKALYRKYRPNTFDEVVGQHSIVVTLLNAVKNDKLAHAYLFCGPRGTGKTTIAKLLAKTINCQSEGNKPCGKCDSCISIQESSNPDVIELDAATNNGVDEVRDIIEKVKYAPLNGKYKVYIIDEVHMMTPSAFNALLKTLEEPPAYCIFILATTEPHKILPTIVSRCQRFDFKKIDNKVIAGRLAQVCEKENINIDDEALQLVAELADGGMRDALSILDQCIAFAQDNIKASDVSEVYGVASLKEKLEIFNNIYNKETKKIVDKIADISARGLDIRRLIIDLINIAKEAVIYNYSDDAKTLNVLNKKQADQLLKNFSTTQLLDYVDYLIDTQGKIRESANALTYLEVCLLKMIDYDQKKEIRQVIVEKEVIREVESKNVKKEEPVIISKEEEYEEYSDEEFFNILLAANKKIKEEVTRKLVTLRGNEENSKLNSAIDIVLGSSIMAASEKEIIIVVNNRTTANLINEKGCNKELNEIIKKQTGLTRKIIAVTKEQQNFLVNYFMARRSNMTNNSKNETNVSKVDEKEQKKRKIEEIFGKDGFDVIEG